MAEPYEGEANVGMGREEFPPAIWAGEAEIGERGMRSREF
jgi:hypothetical protein